MAGVYRDRTNLYITFRQSFAHSPNAKRRRLGPSNNGFAPASSLSSERQGLMSSGPYDDNDGDAVIEMDLLPPRWLDVQDEVTDLLASIARKGAELDKLHQKHVLPGFDDEEVKAREERTIERMTGEITRGFYQCQSAIQRIEGMVREAKRVGGNAVGKGDETMARNLQVSLAGRVQEASATFRRKQSNYLKKLRTLGGLTAPISSPSFASSSTFDASLMDSETDKSFSQSTLQQTNLLKQKKYNTNDVAIAQREKEINEIAQGIIELADIFKELQSMVIDQGTMLDRIDYNIDNMAVNVKEADKELNVATNYQRKYTKRKILFLLFLLVVGLFIFLLVKPKRSSNPPPPPPSTPDTPGQGGETGGGGGGSGGDPIGSLGQTRPQPIEPLEPPDIVLPNDGVG